MTHEQMLLKIARDEAQTLVDYSELLEETGNVDKDVKAIVDEIMGDEFNHCLLALISASKLLDVPIATDDISPDPNDIEVE